MAEYPTQVSGQHHWHFPSCITYGGGPICQHNQQTGLAMDSILYFLLYHVFGMPLYMI